MDPIRNPYTPGAGTPPPELAGRDALRELVRVALARVRLGRPSKSVLMVGLRGVGKTVLLQRMSVDAASEGMHTLQIEAPERRSLPSLLAPKLREALFRLSRSTQAKDMAERGLRALAGLVGAFKMKYQDIELSMDVAPEPGLADNGVLDDDLPVLFEAIGEACRKAETALVLFMDELQYVPEEHLASLIISLHHVAQRQLPVAMVGAGLPQLRGRTGKAKSYAERLFEFPEVGALRDEDARYALTAPAEKEGVTIEPEALDRLLEATQRYPYFLQEWGKHVWDVADEMTIRAQHVDAASDLAIAALDESFFMVRFDRMTPTERQYLRAMAELGPGPHRSGDIAQVLNRRVESLGPIRSHLIAKGMVWSPSHGDTAFTVPLFDQFMKRIMPQA